ncbi:antibiotic biosynthesis monooxygenase [Subtercola boreus]|uniref:Antibiotic biosynthesis monooxygenase n=1 Tax=Subtercola boreus TaxID=120213 RepID=A0A3E0W9E0_9MICO|nr:antibiotic biosynthesis monooxygenase [Subtercola boreus]RFA19855.1 antibiotic biosynthesis monooxygenase [Subtercola boreus]RFA19922.1 antibiotic biosynthesis monooxygenase [Subtercola boreus]RFA26315.1 antibiotic biosynthesis monooxygenase [Subtercola boreus]
MTRVDPTPGAGGAGSAGATGPAVSLVIQRRVLPGSDETYRTWQRKLGTVLSTWPGFLGRDVIEPSPPTQTDWVLVQRFVDVDAARGWLQSSERAALFEEIADHFVGQEEIHLVTENERAIPDAASIIVTSRVDPKSETAFLAWQRKISAAEAAFPGFQGHKIERPTPGVQEDWTVILSFDTDEHLAAWTESPQRQRLLAEGEAYNSEMRVSKSRYGFGFWGQDRPSRLMIFKDNLLVLLVLYPIVFLFGYLVGTPFLSGVPFWLSLFIGNVVSTQLLGWLVAPWIFRVFAWWHTPGIGARREVLGYVVLVVLYGASMALDAWLIARGPLGGS